MGGFVTKIYESSFNIWNTLIDIAMTLFKTSPTSASGSVYYIAHTCFNAISSISVPIAIVFFILAIIKDVLGTPPEQQARKFIQDALKFGVLVSVLMNLWLFMGYIMQVADGVTDTIGISGTYTLSMSSDLSEVVSEVTTAAPSTSLSYSDVFAFLSNIMTDLKEYIGELKDIIVLQLLLVITAAATFVLTLSAGFTIINCAFQRIIKPLVILPFSTITIAMAAGSGEAERISTSYLKTFFGMCLSGAFMVMCVKLGAAIINGGVIALDTASSDLMERLLYVTVQTAITPIVTAGLVKNVDSMISKFF